MNEQEIIMGDDDLKEMYKKYLKVKMAFDIEQMKNNLMILKSSMVDDKKEKQSPGIEPF